MRPAGTAPMTAAGLTPYLWRLGRGDGSVISDRFRLLPDGRITGDHHPNESVWSIADGRLLVSSSDGAITSVFDEIAVDGHHTRLRGRFRSLDESREVVHTLRPNLDDLFIETEIDGRGRPVFVSFASHGRPYDPEFGEPRWEFYRLPIEQDWHVCRIAERRDPHFWYLNKTQRIVGRLTAILEKTTGPVVLCGLSSGGYASLMFGELLTRRFPHRRITTVSINPQTVHGPVHRAFFESYVPRDSWPATIEDDALAQRDIAIANIDDQVTRTPGSRGNIRHVVLFDELSLAEAYHAAFIGSLPGFELIPYRLGMDHTRGIEHIFATGDAQAAMLRSVL